MVRSTAWHDTTADAISVGLLDLIRNPGEWEKLRANPKLMPLAVEESIRFTSPTTNFMRTAARDVELHGVTITKGDDVYLSYAGANRDPRVFEAPDSFQIHRPPNRHLRLGVGPHVCVGQVLAKIEIKTLFAALLEKDIHFDLAGEPSYVQAIWVSALKTLPVRLQKP